MITKIINHPTFVKQKCSICGEKVDVEYNGIGSSDGGICVCSECFPEFENNNYILR